MQIESALSHFSDQPLLQAARSLFRESLNIPLSPLADAAITPQRFFRDALKDVHGVIESIYLVGRVEDGTFAHNLPPDDFETVESSIGPDYEGLFILAVDLGDNHVTRTDLSNLTRDFNRAFKAAPVIVVYKYDHDQTCISLASCERSAYRQQWRDGEKPGKVSLLKDILPVQPHAAHLRFLLQLTVPERGNNRPTNFRDLHKFWQRVFDNRVLNEQFYKEVAAWYQHAIERIRLPDCPPHFGDDSEAHVKDFAVRLICRLMFSWFLKERGLIPAELLELKDYRERLYPLVQDATEAGLGLELFSESSSYYRAILQNLFFNALHTPITDRNRRTTEWYRREELHADFDWSLFERVPYINAALFEQDEGDNVSNRSEEGAFSVPNELFYAEEIIVQRGAGARNRFVTKGLNRIFAQYKFTIEENTSLEEEVALDPELLGMVFENLLAEIDPNEDGSAKSARSESGAYYTPRRIIDYMVNESLRIHLRNAMGYREGTLPEGYEDKLENLLYFDELDTEDTGFRKAIVEALDKVKVLDPACGSGAFPVGMLNRMVQLLKLVDPDNHLWIELQVQRLPDELQEQTRQDLLSHDNNYPRKLGLIRNAIYGVDIQPMAVMITKLRFFISLLIDQKIDLTAPDQNYGMEQLPQMETKVICANSLQNFEPDLIQDAAIANLTRARKRYYQRDLSPAEQSAELATIITTLDEAFPEFYKAALNHPGLRDEAGRRRANRRCLENWFHFGSMAAPFFNLRFFFPEVAQHGGFDIVIGNPPYGGKDISNELKDNLGLLWKDPYGAFISRFIANHPPLKRHGVLSYIVSDTFMTIKSHKPLREQLLQSFVHRIIRVHRDTFKATVNTAIIVVERETRPAETGTRSLVPNAHRCVMGDLTNISIHDHYARFLQLLYRTTAASEVGEAEDSGMHVMTGCDWRSESSPEYALYQYPQNLILTNSNIPFFVSSPKVFEIMQDIASAPFEDIFNRQVNVFTHDINMNRIKRVKLGAIAEVPQGISTGQNSYYIRKTESTGGYSQVDYSQILSDIEIEQLSDYEKSNGVNPAQYGGRKYIPFDKGSITDSENNWLANYYVLTEYYIDWSENALQRMRSLTIAKRKQEEGLTHKIKQGDDEKLAAALRNQRQWFKSVISFSPTGEYSPTFRLGVGTVSQNTSSGIIVADELRFSLLGILASTLARYLFKNFHNHTVHTQEGDVVEFPLVVNKTSCFSSIEALVHKIIEAQKTNPRYDYASNEQLEIDRLVYEAYGLNEDDIREVENWYARRYPALAAAQRANLERKLAQEVSS